MARAKWDELKSEFVLIMRNRSDISTRSERWLRSAYLMVAYSFRFYDFEKKVTVKLGGTNEKTLPPDAKFILSVRDLTNKRRLAKVDYRYIDNLTSFNVAPLRYSRFGTDLLFDSAPSIEIDVQVRYKRDVAEPVFSGQQINTPETPEEWDDIILAYAAERGYNALWEVELANVWGSFAQRLVAQTSSEEEVDDDDDQADIRLKTY